MSTRGSFISVLTILAVLAVAVGVAMFSAVVSVAGGFIDAFRDRVLGVNAHVLVMKHGLYFSEYEELQDEIESIDGVTGTAPFILHEMLVTSANSRSRPGALVKGVHIPTLQEMTDVESMLIDGDLSDLTYAGELEEDQTENSELVGVVLGHVLASRLQVEVGETITLISPLRGLEAAGWRPRENVPTFSRFEVHGIVNTGFYDYDSRLILMDYHALQDLFGRGDVVTGIEVRVDDVFATDETMALINERLTPGRYRVLDWPQINRNLFASLKLQKLALTIVMTIVIFVASFVIFCVLFMLVTEKRSDIAILRSMGASAGGIQRVFLFEGMTIGVVGTILGLGLGYVVCMLIAQVDFGLELEVYRIDALPVSPRPFEFALAAAGALFWCFVATIYPAYSASRISPIEALRYE